MSAAVRESGRSNAQIVARHSHNINFLDLVISCFSESLTLCTSGVMRHGTPFDHSAHDLTGVLEFLVHVIVVLGEAQQVMDLRHTSGKCEGLLGFGLYSLDPVRGSGQSKFNYCVKNVSALKPHPEGDKDRLP